MRYLTKQNLLSLEDYEKIRDQKKQEILEIKKARSFFIGPDARVTFENFETIWFQIQEMLRVEKGGEPQMEDEIEAYAPMLPQGKDLVLTLFFEISDATVRHEKLSLWGGVENHLYLSINGEKIYGKNVDNLERTNASGKTSAVHFLKFSFSDEQIARFKQKKNIILGFDFKLYSHMTMFLDSNMDRLIEDFDG